MAGPSAECVGVRTGWEGHRVAGAPVAEGRVAGDVVGAGGPDCRGCTGGAGERSERHRPGGHTLRFMSCRWSLCCFVENRLEGSGRTG